MSPLALALALLAQDGAVVRKEFIYEKAPFPSCHASTIVESGGGLVAAWFGGTAEKNPDVGIWLSRHEGGKWTEPVEVVNGVQEDGKRWPNWNPVLFQRSKGPLVLFYKEGPSPSLWWGELVTSEDGGKTWSKPERLPQGTLGPIKNKPIELADGSLLCPSSSEFPFEGWKVHLESTSDLKSWTKIGPLCDGKEIQGIQPSILTHGGGKLQILCRNRKGNILEAWSEDGGKTWGPLKPGDLPNPNSGLDAVTLKDGRHVLIYNNTPRGRTPLTVAVSRDGKAWVKALDLETDPGEYSYPAVIQSSDGRVHVTYTWKRERVRHVVLDPSKL
jgi:predicted neuraminidase